MATILKTQEYSCSQTKEILLAIITVSKKSREGEREKSIKGLSNTFVEF